MEFALFFHSAKSDFTNRDDPELAPAIWGAWKAYIGAMAAAGVMNHGNGLMPPESATNVRIRDGKRQVQDGPYADSKEMLGGYVTIDVENLEAALEWASRSPAAETGTVEVRPVMPPMPS